MADFTIKRNDTKPYLLGTLQANGAAYDLTGATVKFIMCADGAPLPKVDAPATITNPAGGMVQYNWIASDTDTEGVFNCEWEVTDSGGEILTFPNGGDGTDYFTVEDHRGSRMSKVLHAKARFSGPDSHTLTAYQGHDSKFYFEMRHATLDGTLVRLTPDIGEAFMFVGDSKIAGTHEVNGIWSFPVSHQVISMKGGWKVNGVIDNDSRTYAYGNFQIK